MGSMISRTVFYLSTIIVLSVDLMGADRTSSPSQENSPFAEWVEEGFPFFSSILDARNVGPQFPNDNLTPRGLILNLGHDCWVCFDTDLLRVAAMWTGQGVTPDALAPKSYHPTGTKTKGGQLPAPRPEGDVWVANGIYPGWQRGTALSLKDPRESAPSSEEVGRGPLSDTEGRFKALRLVEKGVVLEYTAGDATVKDWFVANRVGGRLIIERHLLIDPSEEALLLAVGKSERGGVRLDSIDENPGVTLRQEAETWILKVGRHAEPVSVVLSFTQQGAPPESVPREIPSRPSSARWPEEVMTRASISTDEGSYVVDQFQLPLRNPWRRNIRPADIQFLTDGTGVVVALDGDVWLLRGLEESSGEIRWRRFASGLHEPMTAAIRDDGIYVFDRNGIWRLRDTDGNGEADVHELFSNTFGQTADMREFPSTIRLAPGGEFVIAKGGQQATTLGKHNGSVLRISSDGRNARVLGYGFRQPNIGVHPLTGLVTASDQEGHYIPTTPLHIVRDGQFYGYLANGLQAREQYPAPIAEPLTWIPHPVNASATSQVWLIGAKMGALNDSMVHIGFNRPELFSVLMNGRGTEPQAAVVSVTQDFDFPPLNGAVHPQDGMLYIAGFQIHGWGTTVDTLGGLGRVRYTGRQSTLPREVVPMDSGILLRFDVDLDPNTATDPDRYSIESWHYRRTYQYGSAQYKRNGKAGVDWHVASSAYLSEDGRGVFIGVPDLRPAMQLRVAWSLATSTGARIAKSAYTTPRSLARFRPLEEGFGDINVDLTPRRATQRERGPVTVEEGERLYQLMGCSACHTTAGEDMAKVGPTWAGLYGRLRSVVEGAKTVSVKVDEAYLRSSILEPSAQVVKGFERGEYAMPSYAGVVTDSQIEALVLFIKTLGPSDPTFEPATKVRSQ